MMATKALLLSFLGSFFDGIGFVSSSDELAATL
jgi:hypothetical protein